MDTKKSTVYVAGFPAQVDENQLLEAFVTFGDILEISIPHEPHEREYTKLASLPHAPEPDGLEECCLNF